MHLAGAVVAPWSLTKRWLGGRFKQIFLSLNSANLVKIFREYSIEVKEHSDPDSVNYFKPWCDTELVNSVIGV